MTRANPSPAGPACPRRRRPRSHSRGQVPHRLTDHHSALFVRANVPVSLSRPVCMGAGPFAHTNWAAKTRDKPVGRYLRNLRPPANWRVFPAPTGDLRHHHAALPPPRRRQLASPAPTGQTRGPASLSSQGSSIPLAGGAPPPPGHMAANWQVQRQLASPLPTAPRAPKSGANWRPPPPRPPPTTPSPTGKPSANWRASRPARTPAPPAVLAMSHR